MSQLSEVVKPRANLLKWALIALGVLGVAAVLYIIGPALISPRQQSNLKGLAKGEMAKLIVPAEAGAAPATSFTDAAGKRLRIADFSGKVVVLNLWATWCAPCVVEMPTLAKLAAEYEGQPVEVVALSIDNARGEAKARAFISQHAPLKFYQDAKLALPFALKPQAAGMPTTVIFGRDGVERARLSGGADWAGPQAKAVIDAVLAEK